MRTQFAVGIGILLFFLLLGLFSAVAIDKACSPISGLLEQAGNVAAAGDAETAAMLLHSANLKWKSSWHKIAILADHTPMDEIDGLFAQATVWAEAKDPLGLSAGCHRLASLVEAIAEAHSLTWWNLV